MDALSKKLPPETSAVWKVEGLKNAGPVKVFGAWGTVDFSTLTLAQADKLVGEGFPYLVRKKKGQSTPTPTPVETDPAQ